MSDYPKINLFNRTKEEISKVIDECENWYEGYTGTKWVRVLGDGFGVGLSLSTVEELRRKNNNNELFFRTGPEFPPEKKLSRRERREQERKKKKNGK